MAFIFFNPNPDRSIVGDCVIRGISLLMNKSWEEVYLNVCNEGYLCMICHLLMRYGVLIY